MHGLISSISASWSRSKLKTKNTKSMGDHSHINNDTHRLPHIWPYIFTPLTSAQNPCFCQKLSPKVLFLSHCPEFWKFFTQRPLMSWNLRKRYPNAAYFLWLLSLKDPFFLPCIHVCLRGMLLPQTRSEAGKFCILETESSNLVNTFRCKFNKGDESKISVLQAQPTQLCIIWMYFIGGQGWYTGRPVIINLVKHGRGYILQTPSINLPPWLSKQMPSVSEDVRADAF